MRTIAFVLGALALSGCAIHVEKEARMHDMQAGVIIPATYRHLEGLGGPYNS